MKLSTRMTFVSLGITVITAIIVVLIFNNNNARDYMAVEEHVFEKRIEEKADLLEQSLTEMQIFVRDWAYWDMTYAYINGNNPTFIEDNMTLQSYPDYHMDYFAIFDKNMEPLYDAKYNKEKGRIDAIQPKILNIFKEVGEATGVMEIDGQWIVYSSSQISSNGRTKDPEGLLVYAYDLSPEIARQTGRIIHVELERSVISKENRPEGYKVVTDKQNSDYGIETGFLHTKESWSKAYIYYPVLNSDEELEMSFVLENSIQRLGDKQNIERTLLIVFVMMSLGGILTWIVRYMLISRIVSLETQMHDIAVNGFAVERMDEHHNDELGRLARSINRMLDELESVHDEIKYLADYDELTGALRRGAGLRILEKGIQRSRQSNVPLTVAYIDIDGLKYVNDHYGHIEGDTLIRTISESIITTIKPYGTMVRMGGDEFLVILLDIDIERVYALMEESRQLLHQKVEAMDPEPEYSMSFSYGVASYDGTSDVDTYVEIADTSMYRQRAKDRRGH